MGDVKTVLMFVGAQCGHAREAVALYEGALPHVVVSSTEELEPTLFQCTFSIGDAKFVAFDSARPHDFTFTPAVSIWVDITSDVDMTYAAATLADGGRVHMPIANYGFSQSFTWVDDRFGVSWQLNVPLAEGSDV